MIANKDFKIQYGEALVQLTQPKETGLTTPSPAKLKMIKFCAVRQSQSRCKQMKLCSKLFGCGMFV